MPENNVAFPSDLFRSTIRQEVLRVFFTNPGDRYYVRQLQLMLGVSVGSLHRELDRLERVGVLRSERVANARFFQADATYPLFSELRGIVDKTLGVSAILSETLAAVPGVSVAFIFGSVASGEETGHSDIDLFLIGEFDHGKLNKELRRAEERLGREVEYVARTEQELRAERLSGSDFLEAVLGGPRRFVIGGEDELRRLVE